MGADTSVVSKKHERNSMAGDKSEWKTPRYGRLKERQCTPTRAKAQDTRASPNNLETHLMRK